MKVSMTAISERQRARFNIFKKQKKMRNVFICTKSKTLRKRQDNSRSVFTYKKHDTLRYAIFYEIFGVGIYIQKA